MLLLENEKKYENINQLLAFGAERFTLRLAPFQPPVIEALYERDKKDSSWPRLCENVAAAILYP
jgi:hypothetical protein